MSTALKQWFDSAYHTEAQLRARCQSTHPNHEYNGQIDGVPMVWSAWCERCDAAGFNSGGRHNQINPSMAHTHIAELNEQARLDYAAQQLRKRRVAKLPRCTCPTCGTEHIKR